MARFTVRLEKNYYWAASAISLPADLVLTPESWSASDRGGCKQAQIRAGGSAESLAYLTTFLGDRIEIMSEEGECVWWGDLWDIEISLGALQVNLSLEDVTNRVAVTYAVTLPDGTEESRTTTWVEDSNSVNHYGRRELLHGMTGQDRGMADNIRDDLLRRLSMPGMALTTVSDTSYGARLTAQGTWSKADRIYFINPLGQIENMNENGTQVIGMTMTSTQIHFGESSGGTYATEATEMTIEGGGTFAPLKKGDDIYIEGSTAIGSEGERNNGQFNIEKMDHDYQIGVNSEFVTETMGASIRLSYGDKPSIDYIAQKFMNTVADWVLTKVSIPVRKIGSPPDSLRVAICANNAAGGGVPGTILSVVDTPGSSLYTELTWTEIEVPPLTLQQNVPYWLQIQRDGARNSLADGYEISTDEDMSYGAPNQADGLGVLYVKTAGSGVWSYPNPDIDLPFRLIGEIDTTEQMRKVIDAVDSFSLAIIEQASDIMTPQYETGTRTCMDLLEELLETGNGAMQQYVVWVARDRSVVVDTLPTVPPLNYTLGSDGRVRYANGSEIPPGRLIYGQVVSIDSLILFDSLAQRAKQGRGVYIRQSNYDAASDRLLVMGEGAPDPWSALKLRRG